MINNIHLQEEVKTQALMQRWFHKEAKLIEIEIMTQNKQIKYQWYAELFMVVITGIIAILVLLPILKRLPYYHFFWYNTIFIIAATTFTRWIFLMQLSPYCRNIWFYVVLCLLTPIIVFALTSMMFEFRSFIDERGTYELVKTMREMEPAQALGKYIRNEMIFFGVMSILSSIILFVTSIIKAWKIKNR